MPYHFFDISKDEFWQLSSGSIDSFVGNVYEWDNYDKHCKRRTINLPKNMINHMYQLTNLKYPIEIENTVTHYVKYNIDKSYAVDTHDDHCKITIIVYLHRDDNLYETLTIDDNKIEDNYWITEAHKYRCMVMWSENDDFGAIHSVDINGDGNRDILCMFLG